MRPVRACLSGEDLDWLGGRSVCLALDLPTRAVPRRTAAPQPRWADEIWAFLRERVRGLADAPPPVEISGEAPAASGLSSSTAMILALFDAFAPETGRADRVRWAYEFEFAFCHGGGMDQIAIDRGGVTFFAGRGTGLPDLIGHTAFPPEWSVIVVDSRDPKSTPDHIRLVRAQQAADDPALHAYRRRCDRASATAWSALGARDLPALHDAMTEAHGAMRDLQRMSTPRLERLRTLAADAAGLPLKVSGAGGGGALVGVCRTPDLAAVADALRAAYRADASPAVVLTPSPCPPS
ncbi:GHMP family kinase ATP-binding protein [Catenuloplanes japonicus]|uniref:GHMP family kinase ATP-binding protein n=1 Tax=Catenuloplanes japonicus TaxID=33876 RepID=UPI0018DD1BC3|nr:hypothetical protein [Catenuloplanes japonicus]